MGIREDSMLMASNNMQFTIQAFEMMSVCYIYVRAMSFKENTREFSAKSCEQKV